MSDDLDTGATDEAAMEGSDAGHSTVAGWYLDQTGRFGQRYWDGSSWTEHVRTGLREQTDPLVGGAVHVRLTRLEPDARLFDDIAVVLDRGRRSPAPQAAPAADDVASPAVVLLPEEGAVEPRGIEEFRAQATTKRALILALVSAVLALIPAIGVVGILGGTVAIAVALHARRRCLSLELETSRPIDAALLGLLAAATAFANLLLSIRLANEGVIAETLLCSLDGQPGECLQQLLRASLSIVTRAIAGG